MPDVPSNCAYPPTVIVSPFIAVVADGSDAPVPMIRLPVMAVVRELPKSMVPLVTVRVPVTDMLSCSVYVPPVPFWTRL